MLGEPPVLTIRRAFERPSAEAVAALAAAPTSHLVDCLMGRGALGFRIKPLAHPDLPSAVAGAVVTCRAGPDDNLAVFAALDIARAGDVLVCATEGFTGAAVVGDNLMAMMRNKGVAGFVTDGLARDLDGIAGVGLALFCRGLSPNSPVAQGPGSAGLPIVLGEVCVEPGDVAIGDADGVVIVPGRRIGEVTARLAEVQAAERTMAAKVRDGLVIPDRIRAILDSDRVERVD